MSIKVNDGSFIQFFEAVNNSYVFCWQTIAREHIVSRILVQRQANRNTNPFLTYALKQLLLRFNFLEEIIITLLF